MHHYSVIILTFALFACETEDDGVQRTEPFIALVRDFEGFQEWESFAVPSPAAGPHAGSDVVVFINDRPKKDVETFPPGTVIVKAVQDGAPQAWNLHAMVKRGADFNAAGALGWEFFDLRLSNEEVPVIIWRGPKPPLGHGYELANPEDLNPDDTDCNTCHTSAHNDAVLSTDLQFTVE